MGSNVTGLKSFASLFENFAEAARDSLFIFDPVEDRFIYMSPAHEKLFQQPVDELYRSPWSWLERVVEEDLPGLKQFIEEVTDNPGIRDVDYRIRWPNGQIRYITARLFPLPCAASGRLMVAGIAQDDTDRRQSELRVSQFYSTVSHELRTPLTSIKSSLSLIQNDRVTPDEAKELISIAHGDCDRLIRLINDILDIRKIEAGQLPLKIKQVSVARVLGDVKRMHQLLADEASVSISIFSDADLYVQADEDRLNQILTNIVANAIKFSPPGAGVEIGAQLADDPRFVHFYVKDEGPGIAEENMHLLFQPFQQVHPGDNRPHGGTGLGLHISKTLVERLGGRIGVQSELAKGSTFWFELSVA